MRKNQQVVRKLHQRQRTLPIRTVYKNRIFRQVSGVSVSFHITIEYFLQTRFHTHTHILHIVPGSTLRIGVLSHRRDEGAAENAVKVETHFAHCTPPVYCQHTLRSSLRMTFDSLSLNALFFAYYATPRGIFFIFFHVAVCNFFLNAITFYASGVHQVVVSTYCVRIHTHIYLIILSVAEFFITCHRPPCPHPFPRPINNLCKRKNHNTQPANINVNDDMIREENLQEEKNDDESSRKKTRVIKKLIRKNAKEKNETSRWRKPLTWQ